jgi:predicted RNA-binding Zn-ribbon protein involved in translation (DUF1610 family)
VGDKHVHQTILRGAAEELLRTGTIRTFDAVYRWVCPDCGHPDRTTRLADTIYTLRHAYGWEITTHAESGNLAIYTLVKAGDMPGDKSAGPHPRRLVRDYANRTYEGMEDDVAPSVDVAPRWACVMCSHETTDPFLMNGSRQLGDYWTVPCPDCNARTIYRPVR